MKNMFYGLSNVTSLDLSSFDTRNVKQMDNMFQRVSKLDKSREVTFERP
ncbi:BspA family leucine-rich repeat surface protein [TM7 phylum sp. oral taxon 351]|nr:BspA family leucine-rich repeat surface protein [TM7 phylum sp. oral taxon 351]